MAISTITIIIMRQCMIKKIKAQKYFKNAPSLQTGVEN
jgi:hypothetical protein